MSVYKKLMQARIMLQSVKMKKSGHNKFAGYEYFELADFIPDVQRIFNEIGLCGVVSFSKDLASLTITDIDDVTQQIVITSPMATAALKGCHEIQNLGAVETYERRYLWVAAMEILEHDALDSSNPKDNEEKTKKQNLKDPYPEAEWVKKATKWRNSIESGEKKAQALIDYLLTIGTITDERKDLIRSWEPKEGDIPQ
jgi:hypothetical protein